MPRGSGTADREGSLIVPNEIRQQIDEKNQQMLEVCQQGRYKQAMLIAKEVSDLTLQDYGEHYPDYAQSLNSLTVLYRETGKCAPAMIPVCEIRVYKTLKEQSYELLEEIPG